MLEFLKIRKVRGDIHAIRRLAKKERRKIDRDKENITHFITVLQVMENDVNDSLGAFDKYAPYYESVTGNVEPLANVKIHLKSFAKEIAVFTEFVREQAYTHKAKFETNPKAFHAWLRKNDKKLELLRARAQAIEDELDSLKGRVKIAKKIREEEVEKNRAPKTVRPKKEKKPKPSMNAAGELLARGQIITTSSGLKRLAIRMGYKLVPGKEHTNVFNGSNKLQPIPKHPTVNRNTARKIMQSFATGRF